MLKKDLHFNEKKDKWLQSCIWNSCFPKFVKKAEKHLELASNTDEFIDRILEDKELVSYQGYAELSKICRPDNHWYKVREMFGDRTFKTASDSGSLKIGNESFSLLIPNGIGDGITRVAVFSKEERENFNNDMMDKFFTSVNGEFYIYDYDCANNKDISTCVRKLNGRYGVYVYQGLIALVEW